MDKTKVYNDLKKKISNVFIDESMKKYTSFKIGGLADILVKPINIDEIKYAISYCKNNNIPYYIIGNGTNLLIKDKGIRGVVIRLGDNLNNYIIKDSKITASAGISIVTLAQLSYKNELTGLEFACGIPGTLGGAIRMNAGAFKGEMCNIIESTTYLDKDGNIVTINNKEHEFEYRDSIFKKNHGIIIEATIALKKGNIEEIKEKMDYNTKIRLSTQPIEFSSAGSSFKRPTNAFPGELIEKAGLKNYTIGGAAVSNKHANFIINTGNATAQDVIDLMQYIQDKVYEKFHIKLEPEVIVLGE